LKWKNNENESSEAVFQASLGYAIGERAKENFEMKGCHNVILSQCEASFTYCSVAVSQAGLRYVMV